MINPTATETKRSTSVEERDLLSRLYREIGISAVAAALQIREEAPSQRRISAQKLTDKPFNETLAA
jgi:hypothetical protein